MEEYLLPISGKRKMKFLFELEKKESLKLKSCQKIVRVDEHKPSVQLTYTARAVQVGEIYLPKPEN